MRRLIVLFLLLSCCGDSQSAADIDADLCLESPDGNKWCSIYAQENCLPGYACYYKGEGYCGECLPEGAGTEGDACSVQSDCAGGFLCTSGACAAVCAFEGACDCQEAEDGVGTCL